MLAILCVVFVIFLIVNHLMKQRSRKAHSHSSSERGDYGIDSSTASGLASIYGSNAMLTCDFQTGKQFVGLPRQPNDVGTDPYHLNRSNNWWF